MLLRSLMIGAAGLTIAACTTTGNVERNAAGGAALGALAGAAIGNNVGDGDAGDGALAGAAVGAAAGAYRGYAQDQRHQVNQDQPRYYDQQAGRYFYIDEQTGRSYWDNGQYRG